MYAELVGDNLGGDGLVSLPLRGGRKVHRDAAKRIHGDRRALGVARLWQTLIALLCGLGGGNFASSMANISFFFPKKEKGNALALNAGLGNLGVSVVQFVIPIAITAGVFGFLGGDPQPIGATGKMWL